MTSSDTAVATQPVSFQIQDVVLLEVSFENFSPLPDETGFVFTIQIKQDVEPSSGLVRVFVSADICRGDTEQKVGRVAVGCEYTFSELPTDAIQPNGRLIKPLADTLNSISLSTTRGVIASVVRGTALHRAILPIIDPRTLEEIADGN